TSLRSEERVVTDAGVLIDELNFKAYIEVLSNSKLPLWYINSVGTSVIITFVVLLFGMMCAYALSQLNFPGRRLLYLLVVASFMV
ncbi:carbohydrate ABC transporter permease, partial [Tropicimonas sp. IMCC6043]